MITNRWAFQDIPMISNRDSFPVHAIRKNFPILAERINGKQLVWFDNAATTQKPFCVIERLNYFYQHENSNVHRGAHALAARATDAYESSRETVRRFLNASSSSEIIFVRGTTEAVNLIAQTYGKQNIGKGEEILISYLEHHANIVPWQLLCEETGAVLRVIPVDDSGQILLDEYEKLLGEKTKLVSIAHISNVLGTIVPIRDMVRLAHKYGAKIFVDGAQAVSHISMDVTDLDCDFYAFSGHKIYGPTGIGALYVKSEILQDMHPYQSGGNMIADVTFEKTRYQDAPMRFEAGTGSIGDAAGLGAALEYIMSIGLAKICLYEHTLLKYAEKRMLSIPGLTIVGAAEEKAAIISFNLKGCKDTEVGKELDKEGIAVRTGHHCAQPILRRFGLESTIRASLSFYNTRDEIDEMVRILGQLQRTEGYKPECQRGIGFL